MNGYDAVSQVDTMIMDRTKESAVMSFITAADTTCITAVIKFKR